MLHVEIMRMASTRRLFSTREQFVKRCTGVCSSILHRHIGEFQTSLFTSYRNELRRLFLYIKLITNTSTSRLTPIGMGKAANIRGG